MRTSAWLLWIVACDSGHTPASRETVPEVAVWSAIRVKEHYSRDGFGDTNKTVRSEVWVYDQPYTAEGYVFEHASVGPGGRAAVLTLARNQGTLLLLLRPEPELMLIYPKSENGLGAWVPDGSAYVVGTQGWDTATGEMFELPPYSERFVNTIFSKEDIARIERMGPPSSTGFMDLSPDRTAVLTLGDVSNGVAFVVWTRSSCFLGPTLPYGYSSRLDGPYGGPTKESENLEVRRYARMLQVGDQWVVEMLP